MGFCLFNNVAIAAAHLAGQGEKVLIVDWDAHHGNGTQEAFYDDGRVLFVSVHQYPFYPGTGDLTETGCGDGEGFTVNLPFPAGTSGDTYRAAIEEVVVPAAERFAPTWVLVSAGFDAHRADPLADLVWSAGDYARLAARVQSFVPSPGRTVAFLEGGYDFAALRASVAATAAALIGSDATGDAMREAPTDGGPGIHAVRRTADLLAG
jgi:acetoin utilization deacetylase AcuC-like enzyme